MIARHLQLFASLNDHQVEYLVIGGALAITYGVPRITKDLDIFLNPQEVNAERCLEAMKASGIGDGQRTLLNRDHNF
jgi:predicted nucleotidyltransferase